MTSRPAPARFYRADTYTPEESVGYLMKQVMASIMLQAERRLGPHDLTHAQWLPLLKLELNGRSTVAELARCMQMDAGAMTRLLDRLEKKGLCTRTRSTEDRRVVQVELTPDGEAAAKPVPAVLAEVMNVHLAGFTEDEWQTLKTLLRRMIKTGDALRQDV